MRKVGRTLWMVGLLLSLIAGFSVAASATATTSSLVTYWQPTLVNGNYWCAKARSIIGNNDGLGFSYPPNGAALSESEAWYGATCGNTHQVPAGYLGAQVHLVKSGGTLCGSTVWSTNGSSSSSQESRRDLIPNSSCPAHATYRSEAHAEHWNPNTNAYVKSNWINSPYLGF